MSQSNYATHPYTTRLKIYQPEDRIAYFEATCIFIDLDAGCIHFQTNNFPNLVRNDEPSFAIIIFQYIRF